MKKSIMQLFGTAIYTMIIGIGVMLLSPLNVSASATPNTSWYDADPTAASFTISSETELAGLAKLVNENTQLFANKTIILDNDLDLSGWDWTPIGYGSYMFTGEFDGNGHTISNMRMGTSAAHDNRYDRGGLFGNVGATAVIKNTVLKDISLYISTAAPRVGGLAGQTNAGAKVFNCGVSGEITCSDGTSSNNRIGGLIGWAGTADVKNCYANVKCTSVNASSGKVGGLIGEAATSLNISNCYATGDVACKNTYIGGVIGYYTSPTTSSSYLYWNSDANHTISTGAVASKLAVGSNQTISNTPMTSLDMKSSEFVTQLNANRGSYSSWKLVSGDYPTFGVSDATPPSLTAGAVTRTSDTAGTVKFTSNEAGEYYYAIVADGAGAPTMNTGVAGVACTTAETTITNPTGLNAGAKDIYIKVKDAAGNVSNAIKIDIAAYVAPDITAPSLTAGAVTRTSDIAGTVKFTSNEAGEYYYAIVADGAGAPTINTGVAGVACTTAETTITNPTGLNAGSKDIYIKVKDAAGNVSNAIKIDIASMLIDPLRIYHLEEGGVDPGASAHDFQDYITNVTFSNINNSSDAGYLGGQWHTDYGRSPNQISDGEVVAGETYTLSVKVQGTDFSYQYLAAYIDWNGDGDNGTTGVETLDSGEEVAVWENYGNAGDVGPKTLTKDITIPADATPGKIYMRVMLDGDDPNGSGSYRCAIGYGEIEDYILNISAGAPDITAPSLTAGAVTRTSDIAGTVKFTSNEAGQYYYAIVADGAGEPTINTDGAGVACTTAETTITNPTGLNAGSKDIYIKVKDAAGNVSTVLKIDIAAYVAPDITAPSLIAGDVTRTSDTAGTVKFTSNEAGQYYYAIVADGAGEPAMNTDGAGVACTTDETTITNPTGLNAGSKDIYIKVKDASGNVSAVLKIDIAAYVAPDITAPSLIAGDVTRTSDIAGTVKFTSNEAGEYYYAIVADGAGEPTINTDGAGVACTTVETTITNPTGLNAGAKDIYIKVKDAADNVSAVLKIDIAAYVAPDITAPSLIAGDVTRTSDIAGTVKFTSNEAGQYYYAIVADGAGEPTINTDGAGVACTTVETTITNPTGLTAGSKDIYIKVKDASDNVSAVLKIDIAAYVAPDITAPSLIAGDVTRTSDIAGTVKFTSNEAGQYYYGVVADGAGEPAMNTDGAGVACTTAQTTITNPAGLTAGAKDIYIKVKDAAGNVSAVLKIDIAAYVAPDITAPSLIAGAVTRTSDTAGTVKFTSNEAGSYYYAIVADVAGAPSIDTTGVGTACTTAETTITNPTGLTAGAKDIYIKVKDKKGNVSSAIKIDIAAYVVTNAGSGGVIPPVQPIVPPTNKPKNTVVKKPTQSNDEGIIVKEVDQESDFPTTTLNNDVDNLTSMLLTAAELKRVEKGEDAKIFLEINDISDQVSQEDKAKIESDLEDNVLGMYIDISLFKQIGSDKKTKITNPNGMISVSIQIPESLISSDDSISRTYKIMRLHDGEVSYIEGIYDPTTQMFTFETDQFSTYALVFMDEEVELVAEGDSQVEPVVEPSSNDVPIVLESQDTENNNKNILLLIITISAISIFAIFIVIIAILKKKQKKSE